MALFFPLHPQRVQSVKDDMSLFRSIRKGKLAWMLRSWAAILLPKLVAVCKCKGPLFPRMKLRRLGIKVPSMKKLLPVPSSPMVRRATRAGRLPKRLRDERSKQFLSRIQTRATLRDEGMSHPCRYPQHPFPYSLRVVGVRHISTEGLGSFEFGAFSHVRQAERTNGTSYKTQ